MKKQHRSKALPFSLALVLMAAPLSACGTPAVPAAPQAGSQVETQSSQQNQVVKGKMTLPFEVNSSQQFQTKTVHSDISLGSLRATVDTQPVSITVDTVNSGNGQTIATYQLTGLPRLENDRVYAVDLYTNNDKPLLGGVLSLQAGNSLSLDLDTRSTAILISARDKSDSKRLLNLNLSDIRDIERDPALIDVQLSVGSILRDVGSLTTGILGAVFDGVAGILGRKRG